MAEVTGRPIKNRNMNSCCDVTLFVIMGIIYLFTFVVIIIINHGRIHTKFTLSKVKHARP